MNKVQQEVEEEDEPKKSEIIKARLMEISGNLGSMKESVKGQL